jgi:3',5'-cyclic AMP phosphodiesterase CpdA
MFTLAHLSDIHLGPLPRPRYSELIGKRMLGFINWQKRRRQYSRPFLDRLVADLAVQKPDHIAITGDLVNISLPQEFMLARAWLETVGAPDRVTVIPGNHDAYVHLRGKPGYMQWADYMQPNWAAGALMPGAEDGFPFVRRFGDIALIGLSSARPTAPLMASGRLGRRQLATLGVLLEALREEHLCRIVLVHHPPLPGMASWAKGLHDARAVRSSLVLHGAELVLHGHAHVDSITPLPTANGPLYIIGVASASSAFRGRGRIARYNLYTIEKSKAGWRIHLRSRMVGEDGLPVETDHGLLRQAGVS